MSLSTCFDPLNLSYLCYCAKISYASEWFLMWKKTCFYHEIKNLWKIVQIYFHVTTRRPDKTVSANKPQKLQLLKIKVLNNLDFFFFYHYRNQYAVSYLPILDTSKGFSHSKKPYSISTHPLETWQQLTKESNLKMNSSISIPLT